MDYCKFVHIAAKIIYIYIPLKFSIDTENDAIFEAGDTFFKASFLVSMGNKIGGRDI